MAAFDRQTPLFRGTGSGIPITPMMVLISLVFAVLIGITIFAALVLRSNKIDASQRNLDAAVAVAVDNIQTELALTLSRIQSIRSLFDASENVTRQEFSIFAQGIFTESKGLQALEWVPRINNSERGRFIESVRDEGLKEFDIHPVTEYQVAFPVNYIYPIEGNRAASGFDLYSNETRREALVQAWETGVISVTEPITLVQETGTQSVFLVFIPVYSDKAVPPTVEERRNNLEGFGLAVIRFGDFLEQSIPVSFDPRIEITVIDTDGHPEKPIILFRNHQGQEPLFETDGIHIDRKIAVANENLDFHFGAPQDYGLDGFERASWYLVLIIGTLFSVVILVIVILLYRGQQAALDLSVERLESEQVQRVLASEMTQLIDTANNPIFGVDADGRINIWNDAMRKITGASGKEAIGRFAVDFMTADSKPIAEMHLRSLLSDSAAGGLQLKFLGPTDGPAELLVNCTVRRDAAGEMTGVLAVGLDITERLRAEQEIRDLNESLEARVATRTKELQEAAEEMESFSYSVSHDLRGPLRSINGFSLAVLEKYGAGMDDEGRSYLERVRNATNHMGKLMDDLLVLSRLGRAQLMPEPLDLGKMVEEQAAELRLADPDRQVEFVIADASTAFGDERLVRLLIDNLVRNAWKFSSKHATARIELGKEARDGETVFFVKDDGAGFDMEYANKLFLPFQRLHPTGEFDGTGIGLAIAKRVLQRHGGRIWAEGEVEKGATFYFTLGEGTTRQHG